MDTYQPSAFSLKRYVLILFISASASFLMVALPRVGVTTEKITNFINLRNRQALVVPKTTKPETIETIRPKLEQIGNTFSVYKAPSLVAEAGANSDYNDASSYAVVNFETGEVIAEKNMESSLPIASLTKVMTAVVALDLASPEELFSVSEKASGVIPTKIGVLPGQKWRVEELLNALILTSANDAAEVLREGIDNKYGEKGLFIKAMNEKAKFLGLSASSFANPQGFDDPGNHSSAKDLAILSNYAISHYPLLETVAAKDYQFLAETETHKQADLYNWNGLIGVYPGVKGIKIGSTGKAGKTTIVLAEREGKKVLVTLLGTPGILERDLWASQLLDLGFEKMGIDPVKVSETQLKEKYATWKYWN